MTAGKLGGGFSQRDPTGSVPFLQKIFHCFLLPQREMEKDCVWEVSSPCEEADLLVTGMDSVMTYMDFCYPGDNRSVNARYSCDFWIENLHKRTVDMFYIATLKHMQALHVIHLSI